MALLDADLDGAAMAERIETVGTKPLSDGIEVDAQGRVIVTDIEHGALVRFDADGAMETLL